MANDITLYDAYDRPIRKEILDQELARPSLTGVRSIWNYGYVTGGLTPQKLAALLRDAAEGNADAYLTLAEEMEEKDPHYASVLGTRKRAVARLPIVVEAASDSPQYLQDAEETRILLKRPGTKGMIEDLLDALGKGVSVVENIWNKKKIPWVPGRYEWRDPRYFQYDRETFRELRLKDEQDMFNGIPLAPYKFIVHTPKLKAGIPIRGGLARLSAWSFIFKNFMVKDLMAYAEVFGMPLRLGKYRPGETEDNIAILRAAVANLGSDAAAVIPEGMLIEFIETAKATGAEAFFVNVANWFDKQLSKAILGQTMTTDDGSSKSQAQVHDEVREDIRDADGEQLAETLERDLVKPFLDLNFGPRDEYPRVCFREAERADIPVMRAALKDLVPLGLEVEMSEVRDKLGFSDPAKGAVCLQAAPPKIPPIPPLTKGGDPKGGGISLNSEQTAPEFTPEQQSIENLKAAGAENWQAMMAPMLAPIREIIAGASSFEEAKNRLLDAYGQMDDTILTTVLAQALFAADMCGRLGTSE